MRDSERQIGFKLGMQETLAQLEALMETPLGEEFAYVRRS